MKKFEIRISGKPGANKITADFESAVKSISLTVKLRGTLKMIPDSIHWHIVKESHKGTLEATYDPNRQCLWLSYHDNRQAEWIDEAVPKLKKLLEQA